MSSLSNHYSSLLKLCSNPNNQTQLKKLHCLILKSFYLLQDTFLLNNLISSYSNSNLLKYARNVFDQIPHPNLFSYNAILSAYSKSGGLSQMKRIFDLMPSKDGISWNAVISGYAAYNSPHNAVQTYRLMLRNGNVGPNRITFSTMLILSSARCSPAFGRQVHCQIIKYGFQSHMFVGSPLVDMYSKASLIDDAKKVFDGIEEKNVVVHNTMLTGFLRCGMVEDSRRLFEEMRERDSISWTTMVTGLTQNGLEAQALGFFKEMREAGNGFSEEAMRAFIEMERDGTEPDDYTLGSVISSCANIASLEEGAQFHCRAIVSGLLSYLTVSNAIVTLYGKCGCIEESHQLFDEMKIKDQVSWTALVSGVHNDIDIGKWAAESLLELEPENPASYVLLSSMYAARQNWDEVAKLRKRMREKGVRKEPGCSWIKYKNKVHIFSADDQTHPDSDKIYAELERLSDKMEGLDTFLLNNLISSYSNSNLLKYARNVFDQIPHPNLFSYNAILSAYSKSGGLSQMKRIFDLMPSKDGISWNAVISGYAAYNSPHNAVQTYRLMLRNGNVGPNRITFSTMLILSSARCSPAFGRQVHCQIIKYGFQSHMFVGSPLVDMYSKASLIDDAKKVFDGIEEKNVVVHNTMLTGFLRCGMVEDSRRLFEEMRERDSISWTTMVTGLTQNGLEAQALGFFKEMREAGNGFSEEAMRAFIEMERDGTEPDDYTLGSVISSCANIASLEEGAQFHCRAIVSGLLSYLTVSNAIVTLYGKCGCIEESHQLFDEMKIKDQVSWTALVSGVHNDIDIGKWAAESLLELEPENPASYVLLSSMYAARQNWDEVAKLRKRMREKGVRKEPGCSWIKYKNKVHIFSADDQTHPDSDKIYAELERLSDKMEGLGYKPDTTLILHDVAEAEKRQMLSHHSEKLAIAFGLLYIPEGLPIRVVKNLRVCGDCHNSFKFISKIVGREILVRDAVRFHKFSAGVCSCGDFW
ncbi:uncharacterized protein A4U43_C05F9150 [Asparagus officinalis]|uniref:DYW domain-containing protein n=1 Tax=Asparagus officinalis TaxID=4686 RepID=A0A5P1EVT7_ASPOF|nr:uncharacterized protein A4U43_C05F9150 [Asparagus officinalis]